MWGVVIGGGNAALVFALSVVETGARVLVRTSERRVALAAPAVRNPCILVAYLGLTQHIGPCFGWS